MNTANKKTLFVDKAENVDSVNTVISIETATSASTFSTAGSITIPSLSLIGGGVTGSLSTNLTANVSASQNIDIIPINKGNSV